MSTDWSEVLEQRAIQLAEAPTEHQSLLNLKEFLFFFSGSRSYVLPTDAISGVIPVESTDITFLPGAPASILGVCNVRGRIVQVIDLALLLGTTRKMTGSSRLILVDSAGVTSALLTDGIDGVRALSKDQLQMVPTSWPDHQRKHLQAVTSAGEPVLQLETLLDYSVLGFEEVEEEV